MPKFKVKSSIEYGKKDDKGNVETKTYAPGSDIELSNEEAVAIAGSLVDPPEPEGMDEDEKAAYESIRNRPDNPDSGVFLHFKADPVARAAADAGELGVAYHGVGLMTSATRPESNKTRMELAEEDDIKAAEADLRKKIAAKMNKASGRPETMTGSSSSAKSPAGEPEPKVTRPAAK